MGNSVFLTGMNNFVDSYVKNFGMLIPAAPFAVAGIIQSTSPSSLYLKRPN